jgi:hypothetical protein
MRFLFLGIEPAVIADALECRIGTVNVHLRNCAAKAGVPNRVALQAYVYQHPAVLKRHGHAPRGLDHHPEGCTCERPYCTARRIGEI